jgi:8-oxo-dGTP pyrophosphatase MutT (NUDIX family)
MNKPLHPSLVALRARLAKRPRARVQLPGFRESAVLVPLLLDADAVTQLLYIVRTSDLPTHAGQIAFPGGKRELSDTVAGRHGLA